MIECPEYFLNSKCKFKAYTNERLGLHQRRIHDAERMNIHVNIIRKDGVVEHYLEDRSGELRDLESIN